MKKTTISAILALTVLSCLTASAQWRAGIQAGYTHNWLYTESGYFYTRTYEPRGGFSIGVPVQYEFEDWFALQAEVSYIQKNYRMQRTGFYSPLHENMTNHYLSIPVLAHFSFQPLPVNPRSRALLLRRRPSQRLSQCRILRRRLARLQTAGSGTDVIRGLH